MELTGTNKRRFLPIALLVGVIVVFALIVNVIFHGNFLTLPNINALCISATIAAFMAWGYAFIFALNYMDLSVGAAIVLVIYASGELGNRIGPAGVVIGGLVAGIVLMMVNFNIFAWTKIPSWVAGLGMCLVYEAIAAQYADVMQKGGGYVVLLNEKYTFFGRAPGSYIVLVVGVIVAYLIYNRSTLGVNVRSVGSNPAVAKVMGVNITKTLILTGLVCGIFIGCAGFMRESYALRVYAMTGLSSLSIIFPPLATVFLAQVFSKWINIIIAIPFCALFIYVCYNVLTFAGVPSGTLQEACLGLFVLIFGVFAQRGVKGVVK
jgi:ribose transport system permease protein